MLFDRAMKCQDPVLNQQTSLQFLRAIQTHVDPSEVIWRMMHMPAEFGIKRLREIVSAGASQTYFNATSIPLFEFLSSDGVQRDLYREDVNGILEMLYTTPGYIQRMTSLNVSAGTSSKSFAMMCWFLVSLAKSCSDARDDPHIHSHAIAVKLQQIGHKGVTKLMTVLQPNLGSSPEPSDTATPRPTTWRQARQRLCRLSTNRAHSDGGRGHGTRER